MSDLPMPPAFHGYLQICGEANRSLVFDRGVDRWTHHSAKKSEVDKQAFFAAFVEKYKGYPGYTAFRGRRAAAFERLGAKRTTLHTATRLAIGLGLPHPTETGFLFDRLTGCPYLPGSTVKGLLRAAALVAAGARAPFWTAAEVDRIFGPVIGGDATPATGSVIFYDAFPTAWPVLEVDVLTPHYPSYYRSGNDPAGEPPGDWDNPNPVPFLTIRAGEAFDFWFSPRGEERWQEDHRQLERLLVLALDWFGVGAKKAAGYGYFERRTP